MMEKRSVYLLVNCLYFLDEKYQNCTAVVR